MPTPFYDRLIGYYVEVGKALRGQASTAAIFPNGPDVGGSRERLYAAALRQHLPSSCNVVFGGFLFNQDGNESKQIDIIITNGLAPQFNFLSTDGTGKSFACVDGCVGVVEVKSRLTVPELADALGKIASVPELQEAPWGRATPNVSFTTHYPEFPYKVIFAFDGISGRAILNGLRKYYEGHSDVPAHRRPSLIHVAGKCAIIRNIVHGPSSVRKPEFSLFEQRPDVQAFVNAVMTMQLYASLQHHIFLKYESLVDRAIRAASSAPDARE